MSWQGESRRHSLASRGIIDTKQFEFGSIKWQDAMLNNIIYKLQRDRKLSPEDEIFLEVQYDHEMRILDEAQKRGERLSSIERLLLNAWRLIRV